MPGIVFFVQEKLYLSENAHLNKWGNMRKIASLFVLVQFVATVILPGPGFAQTLLAAGLLPEPGTPLSLSGTFTPAHLQGMVINPADPFKFDFIIHRGDEQLAADQKQAEYTRLIKYFLAALAVPDQEQWVNLSPYEKDRIIPDGMGLTEMGRDLLAQDYILKQLTASLSHPDSAMGRKFWDTIYARAYQKLGTTDIPTDVFNKVWILPDTAEVYEKNNTMVVIKQHLKVMLDSDYQAMKENAVPAEIDAQTTELSREVMREVILPVLEQEVNEGRNFAPLRQVYSGMLLATWYKTALKESILGQLYADKQKVKGVDQDPANNQRIYDRYVEAFRRGVVNMIHEDVDRYSNEVIPRKYFSGGFQREQVLKVTDSPEAAQLAASVEATADLAAAQVKDPEETVDSAEWEYERYRKYLPEGFFSNGKLALVEAFANKYSHSQPWGRFWEESGYKPSGFSGVLMRVREKLAKKLTSLIWGKKIGELNVQERRTLGRLMLEYFFEEYDKQWGFFVDVYMVKDVDNLHHFLNGRHHPSGDGFWNFYQRASILYALLFFWGSYQKEWVKSHPQAAALMAEGLLKIKAVWLPTWESFTEKRTLSNEIIDTIHEATVLFEMGDSPEEMTGAMLAYLQARGNGTLPRFRAEIPKSIAEQQKRYFEEILPEKIAYKVMRGSDGKVSVDYQGWTKWEEEELRRKNEEFLAKHYWSEDFQEWIERGTFSPWSPSFEEPIVDRSQFAVNSQASQEDALRGGIDFARSNLNMRIKRDGAGVPLPASQQDLESIHINGLVPEILSIQPVQPGQIIR